MADVWSFNTTIRNPERMQNMLRALSEMEGIEFDLAGQEMFFGLQIKKRLYKPTKSKLAEPELILAVHSNQSADDLEDSVVESILEKYRGSNVDGSGRGRTAAGILNRFGLCVALQSKGPVVITPLGKKWLANEIDDEDLFTKFFLKWQYPNYIEAGYDSFNIKPFVGVISLITKVNEMWEGLDHKPVGISKDEYRLFVPALTNASEIDVYAEAIVEYRTEKLSKSGKDKVDLLKKLASARVSSIYGSSKPIITALSDLRDYTDSSIRYFRMSGLIAERGSNTHIDIAQDKQVEVSSILSSVKVTADPFDSYEAYFDYLSDIDSLKLPWQNEADLKKISTQLTTLLKSEASEIDVSASAYLSKITDQSTVKQVDILHDSLNEIRVQKLRSLKHNIEVLDECIQRLETITTKRYQTLTTRPSLDFEWYTTRALMVLNDAISIDPSFKIGDDGIPTGFRGNAADIECSYETFGLTVEVTLLLGRDQWIAEGQPVMRHLRDFEERSDKDVAYCLFIAPLIHRDALNTFWTSNKHSYEGVRQNIIPLTLSHFIEILKHARQKITENGLNHSGIKQLLDSFVHDVDNLDKPAEWLEKFPAYIADWS